MNFKKKISGSKERNGKFILRVDEDIIDILELFWKQNIKTYSSCCGKNNGKREKLYISIDMEDLKKINEKTAKFDKENRKRTGIIEENENGTLYEMSRGPTLYKYTGRTECSCHLSKNDNIQCRAVFRFPLEEKEKFIELWKEVFDHE